MNVFLPFNRDKNPVLDEIERCFEGRFIYDDFRSFEKHEIDIVNIHWPESIFGYAEPTTAQLSEFESSLKLWKKRCKIVYTRHNILPHRKQTGNFELLYQLVIKYTDGVIHLGQWSEKEFASNHQATPSIQSAVIPHPAYTIFKNEISKQEARKTLGISDSKKVILVFGSVRNEEELAFILSTLEHLDLPQKHMLISNLNIHKPLPKTPVQRMKKFVQTKLERMNLASKKHLTVYDQFVENEDVQVFMNAADVLFIPRIMLLNSGNLFLGFSFKKVVVGPTIGNLTEFLEKTGNPTYTSGDPVAAASALKDALSLPEKKGEENYTFVNRECQPKHIAESYYKFFKSLNN